MQITISNRRCKCAGNLQCSNLTKNKISLNKQSIYLCDECLRELYESLAKIIIPKSVKSKFKL